MYMTASDTQEKSMDEILASIRQTITDDLSTNDVLELTKVVEDDGTIRDIREEQQMTTPNADENQLDAGSAPLQQPETITPESMPETLQAAGTTEAVEVPALETAQPFINADETVMDTPPAAADPFANFAFEKPVLETQLTENSPNEPAPELGSFASNMSRENLAPGDTFSQIAQPSLTPAEQPRSTGFGEPIMDETTIHESLSALSALSNFTASQARNSSKDLGNGTQTIDGLVRELLRPMLKDWLDANLPSMVKVIVTEQIERITKDRLR